MSDTRVPTNPRPGLSDVHLGQRPSDRFWPYVDVPEKPTDEELAGLDPDLHDALFGRTDRPFSFTVIFPCFEGDNYERALKIAKGAAEYRLFGKGEALRHRARFFPADAAKLRELFEIVDEVKGSEVLVDDRPIPYARELWLPLVWFLLLPLASETDVQR